MPCKDRAVLMHGRVALGYDAAEDSDDHYRQLLVLWRNRTVIDIADFVERWLKRLIGAAVPFASR